MDHAVNRASLQSAFLQRAGWALATISPLAGDASNRRYDRLVHPDGRRAVLMDAPPEKGEDVRPFVDIAQYLTGIGLSAPEIYDQDAKDGFLLIEDLGDALFARCLTADQSMETLLYKAAADVLCHLHGHPPPDLKPYDAQVTVPLAALAFDWYSFGATGDVNTPAKTAFCDVFRPKMESLDKDLSVLIQRDYHAENLLWLPDRKGVARVGLLDFQDAMLGHPCYDLVSVLQDARRDVSPELETQIRDYYRAQMNLQVDAFETAYALCGLQRNMRILGVFARLCMRDGKAHYVDLIPRVWGHIETNLRHRNLSELAPLILDVLPAPSSEILSILKGKCGACPSQ